MTVTIAFDIPGLPIAQPRQHQRVVNAGGRVFASNYTPGKHPVNAFKAAIAAAARVAHPGPLLDGPLALSLILVFPRPASKMRKRGGNPREWSTKKPDIDNLVKSVADALTGILYRDDAQIASAHVQKHIAAGDQQAGTSVAIWRLW